MKIFLKTLAGFIIFLLIAGIIYVWINLDDKEKTSEEFASQLFTFPVPAHTKMIEKEQANGKQLVWGNSGNWGIIASVKYSTQLSKEEILTYYQKAGLFKYPKSDKKGVVPEVYFSGHFKKVKERDGFYYDGENAMIQPSKVSAKDDDQKREYEYVVQLTSDFDYFLKLD